MDTAHIATDRNINGDARGNKGFSGLLNRHSLIRNIERQRHVFDLLLPNAIVTMD